MHEARVGESQERLQQALMKWKTFRETGSLPFFLHEKGDGEDTLALLVQDNRNVPSLNCPIGHCESLSRFAAGVGKRNGLREAVLVSKVSRLRIAGKMPATPLAAF